MPISMQAKKKLRHDHIVTEKNVPKKKHIRDVVKMMRKKPSEKHLASAFQALDKGVKTHIMHKNTASRLKSRLSKLIGKK